MESSKSVNIYVIIPCQQSNYSTYALGIIDKSDAMHEMSESNKKQH